MVPSAGKVAVAVVPLVTGGYSMLGGTSFGLVVRDSISDDVTGSRLEVDTSMVKIVFTTVFGVFDFDVVRVSDGVTIGSGSVN